MFAHHVDNTMEKKLFLKKHNFNNQAYTLCVGLFFCSLSNRVDEENPAHRQILLVDQI